TAACRASVMQLLNDAESAVSKVPQSALSHTRRGRLTWSLFGMLVGAAIAIPASGIAWIEWRGERFVSEEQPFQPVLVDLTVERVDAATPVSLVAAWDAPAELVAPSWEGLVTQAPGAGTTVRSGDTFAVVGGIRRIAWHTAEPFHRELS